MEYKNSEGYTDYTAGIAIRRISKDRREQRPEVRHLTFMIGEVPSFGKRLYRWKRF